jgi:serine protease Do
VGQYAIAVGRSLDVDQVNVSMGILSATDRIWGRAIQTDANISPLNYGGALIDLRGRVLGLLTPMSPDATTELAGSEWYDSGIGFAVPLGDLIQGVLQRMQAGESVMPGLLGITLKGQNMYTSPALIGWCPPNTPAREAGLQVGDEIIELDGKPITRQVQLRHAMGPKVAGESVAIVVRRGGKVVRVSVPLVDHVDPYELPFLGVLLQRHSTQEAVVSYVYPDSPAAKAGIQIADRLVKLAEHAPASRDAWYEAATQYSPGDDASILFERNGKKIDQTITFATQPGSVPDSVGSLTKSETNDVASEPAADKPIADKKVEELSTIRLPDEPNECFLLYPRVEKDEAPGIILWLLPPGEIDRKQVLSSWHESCSRHNFILVLPRPREPIRWHPAEVGVVRRLLEAVLSRQTTDMRRIVVGGEEAGASLACGLAFQYRERARGVVIVDAVLPRGQELRGNDPENRLEFLSVSLADSLKQKLQAKSLAPLRTMKFPIIELNQTGTAETLPSESISRILLWADTLDRL